MATIETFKWCTQLQSSGGSMTVDNAVREISFGNGYRQIASSGRNTNRRNFNLIYGGKDYIDVLDFLYAHTTKTFIWTPPDGRIGIFIVKANSIGASPKGKKFQELSFSFSEEFSQPTK